MKECLCDEDDIVAVPVGDSYALKNFREKANMPLTRDGSVSIRCTQPRYVDNVIASISAIENIQSTRVYPALVHVGQGLKYNEYVHKNTDSVIYMYNTLDGMRKECIDSIDYFVSDIRPCIVFGGKSKSYRFPNTFAGENCEIADGLMVRKQDFFYFYFAVGLEHLITRESKYSNLEKTLGYKDVIIDLKMSEMMIKLMTQHIGDYLVIR